MRKFSRSGKSSVINKLIAVHDATAGFTGIMQAGLIQAQTLFELCLFQHRTHKTPPTAAPRFSPENPRLVCFHMVRLRIGDKS